MEIVQLEVNIKEYMDATKINCSTPSNEIKEITTSNALPLHPVDYLNDGSEEEKNVKSSRN